MNNLQSDRIKEFETEIKNRGRSTAADWKESNSSESRGVLFADVDAVTLMVYRDGVMGIPAVLRGIVSPCRWREFVESATAKKAVETAEVNIKCPFHGYTGGLHNASCERFFGKLDAAVTDVHIVVLTAARAVFKARRVSASPDFISEGN
jgi:hypothetical protein